MGHNKVNGETLKVSGQIYQQNYTFCSIIPVKKTGIKDGKTDYVSTNKRFKTTRK